QDAVGGDQVLDELGVRRPRRCRCRLRGGRPGAADRGHRREGSAGREKPTTRDRAHVDASPHCPPSIQYWARSMGLANHTFRLPSMCWMSRSSMRIREGRPITWGWNIRLKKPPSSYCPSNSSTQISQTSCWLQIPLPAGGLALNPKYMKSSLTQLVGSSIRSPCGVECRYGRSLSLMFVWYTKPCFLRSPILCLLGS